MNHLRKLRDQFTQSERNRRDRFRDAQKEQRDQIQKTVNGSSDKTLMTWIEKRRSLRR